MRRAFERGKSEPRLRERRALRLNLEPPVPANRRQFGRSSDTRDERDETERLLLWIEPKLKEVEQVVAPPDFPASYRVTRFGWQIRWPGQ